jgi:hypothetical protein
LETVPARIDSTIVKALVRAHRWRGMLESKHFATARELARAETINEADLARVLRLTLLSPAITEAILAGWRPNGLELANLLKPFPTGWDKQDALFKCDAGCDDYRSVRLSYLVLCS